MDNLAKVVEHSPCHLTSTNCFAAGSDAGKGEADRGSEKLPAKEPHPSFDRQQRGRLRKAGRTIGNSRLQYLPLLLSVI
jgi:hypothetical protein